MTDTRDPTKAIREQAARFPSVDQGAACNQSSYKAGKGTFLFLGPGAKGVGWKAMFKLRASLPQARQLAAQEPQRFEVGTAGWVTARFTAAQPLPKSIWEKWLAESYEVTCGAVPPATKQRRPGTRRQQADRLPPG